MKDNLTLLTAPQDEMRGQLEVMKRNLGTLIEFNVISARITRAKYEALVSQGFDEKQALELCK